MSATSLSFSCWEYAAVDFIDVAASRFTSSSVTLEGLAGLVLV
jgi:hypothetical protein